MRMLPWSIRISIPKRLPPVDHFFAGKCRLRPQNWSDEDMRRVVSFDLWRDLRPPPLLARSLSGDQRWRRAGVTVAALFVLAIGLVDLIVPAAAEPAQSAAAPLCSGGAICVGPGQRYSTLAAGLHAAHQGDIIEIAAATYHETAAINLANVTLRGIGGRPHFDCQGLRITGDKACLLLAADGITLENLEISGAEVSDALGANGACIRNDHRESFHLRAILCHSSQNGILSNGGDIVIDDSQFYDNGWDGYSHNVYVSGACHVTVHHSTFRDARVGHEFKSRCLTTVIADSTFVSTRGSRDIDIPDGGDTRIYRSTLSKMPGTQNHEIIGFAAESCAHPADMLLQDVYIVNSDPQAAISNHDKCAGHIIIIERMKVSGPRPRDIGLISHR